MATDIVAMVLGWTILGSRGEGDIAEPNCWTGKLEFNSASIRPVIDGGDYVIDSTIALIKSGGRG